MVNKYALSKGWLKCITEPQKKRVKKLSRLKFNMNFCTLLHPLLQTRGLCKQVFDIVRNLQSMTCDVRLQLAEV